MGGDIETAPLLQVENLHTYFVTERGLVRAVEGVSFILAQGVTLELAGVRLHWCNASDFWDLQFDLYKTAKEALDKAGISIP
jgi:hypothetical protein